MAPENVLPDRLSRLRRIVAFPLVLLLIGLGMVAGAATMTGAVLRRIPRSLESPVIAFEGLVVALAAVLAYKAYKRWVERSSDQELALAGAAGELAAGLAFGAALFALAAGLVWLAGGLEVLGVRGLGKLWSLVGIALVSGTVEEIVFRGLLQRLLERLVGTWLALAATSAFFGLAHLANHNATPFSALAITCEAGIMLGAAYLLTRRLWFAIGIHAAWNFTQGWVFSIPISGSAPPIGLLVTRRVGSDLLTGGAFGLEASVVALAVATLAGLVLLYRATRIGVIVPPRWRRGAETADPF